MIFEALGLMECKKLRSYTSRGKEKTVALFASLDANGDETAERWMETFVPESANGTAPKVGQIGRLRVRATVYAAARQRSDGSLFTVDQTGYVFHDLVAA